jgi:hypothetical protein
MKTERRPNRGAAPDPRIGERCIYLAVEFSNDFSRCAPGRAGAMPSASRKNQAGLNTKTSRSECFLKGIAEKIT